MVFVQANESTVNDIEPGFVDPRTRMSGPSALDFTNDLGDCVHDSAPGLATFTDQELNFDEFLDFSQLTDTPPDSTVDFSDGSWSRESLFSDSGLSDCNLDYSLSFAIQGTFEKTGPLSDLSPEQLAFKLRDAMNAETTMVSSSGSEQTPASASSPSADSVMSDATSVPNSEDPIAVSNTVSNGHVYNTNADVYSASAGVQATYPMHVAYGPQANPLPIASYQAPVEPEAFMNQAMSQQVVHWTLFPNNTANHAFAQEVKTPTIYGDMSEMCHLALSSDDDSDNDHSVASPQTMGPVGNMMPANANLAMPVPLPGPDSFTTNNVHPANILAARRAARKDKKAGTKRIKHQPPTTAYAQVPRGDALLQLLGIWPYEDGQQKPKTVRVVDLQDMYDMPDHSTLSKRVNEAIDRHWGFRVRSEFRRIQKRTPKSTFDAHYAIKLAIAWDEYNNVDTPSQPQSQTMAVSNSAPYVLGGW